MATVFHTSLLAPQAIARLNQLWDAAIDGPTSNPMTAPGDIVVGGEVVDGVPLPVRLAKGTEGQALQIVDGALEWVTPEPPTVLPICLPIACTDEVTALTTGVAKVTFRMPFAMTGVSVRASVTTAPTGSVLTVDINEGGVSILSTKLTIDATEKTSTTAAIPAALIDAALANDAEITVDIDTVGSTVAGAGLKIYIIGTPAS